MEPRPRLSIGIDVGTSSIAVAAWDAADRRLEHAVTVDNDAGLSTGPDRFEQDPNAIWRAVGVALERLAARTGARAAAVACTGQMHGLLLVDERLEPVSPLISWQDRRCAREAAAANAELDRTHPGGWKERGCRLHPGYGALTLSWLLRHGGLPVGTRWACTVSDWIAARLCGRLATDPSNAAAWGIASLRERDWDREAIGILGIPESLLPPVLEPGVALGSATLGALGAGVAIRCGLGDNQASVLAAVSATGCAADTCVLNVGTGSQLSVLTPGIPERWAEGEAPLELRPYLDGAILCVGASLNGGASYALLRRFIALLRGQAEGAEDLYQTMERWAAEALPGCGGLVCEPAFYGERGRESLAGSLAGMTAENLTPGNLCRAVLEGMARTLHGFARAAGVSPGALVGSGNAVRKNPLLRDILARTFGVPLQLSPHVEEAAIGAALTAARAL